MPNSSGQPNAEEYTDDGDGTVTDNVTGLMWQQSVSSTTYIWAEARSACSALSLAAHQDWRLPTEIELVSLVDFSLSNPSINRAFFPRTPSSGFWSSTPLAGSSMAGLVDFYYGGTGDYDVSVTCNVRCVR